MQIVDECHLAFIKGKSIHNFIRLIFDMLDFQDLIGTDILCYFLIFIVFDSIEHSFFFGTLHFLVLEKIFVI